MDWVTRAADVMGQAAWRQTPVVLRKGGGAPLRGVISAGRGAAGGKCETFGQYNREIQYCQTEGAGVSKGSDEMAHNP